MVPALSSLTPADNLTNIAISGNTFYLFLDQNIVAGSGSVTLRKTSDDSVVETFDVTDSGEVSVSGSTASMTQTATLDYETEYYLLVDSGAFEDSTGNAFTGIADSTTWSFTTAAQLVFEFERVSVSSAGGETEIDSSSSAISSDGRYVAFVSSDTNLTDDEYGEEITNVFLYDRTLDTVILISGADGRAGDSNSSAPSVSSDARYVTFASSATNLIEGSADGNGDVFLYDTSLDTMTLVSVGGGSGGDGASANPYISSDGAYITFDSVATDLIAGDTNDVRDIFVYDVAGQTIERVSISDAGVEGNSGSSAPSISTDGRYVAFASESTNLTDDTIEEGVNIFLYDRTLDTVVLVSGADSDGGDGESSSPHISADGAYIVFDSGATNLVSGDTNGIQDVFVYTVSDGTIERISSDDYASSKPVVSSNGRYVAFTRETDTGTGIYHYDRNLGTLRYITEGSQDGGEGDYSDESTISSDGSVIAFESNAINLVDDDTNDIYDIFVVTIELPAEAEESESGDSTPLGASAGGIIYGNSILSLDAFLPAYLRNKNSQATTTMHMPLSTEPETCYQWERDLFVGEEGNDVLYLQRFLNRNGFALAESGAGSFGNETTYFGARTKSALTQYQNAYASEILVPLGLPQGTGYFGPATRAFVGCVEGVME